MDVLTFGSIISDVIVSSKQIKVEKSKKHFYLNYGTKIEASFIETDFGGSAHNIAYGIACLGKKSGLIGAVGNDEFGRTIINSLTKVGVNIDGIQIVDKPTGKSVVLIGEDNERTIIIFRGANDFIDGKKISKDYVNLFRYFVFTSTIGEKSVEALHKTFNYAKRCGLTIVANPSSAMIATRKKDLLELLKHSHIAIMNEEEAKQLTKKELPKSLNEIKNLGPDTVVITRDKKGCIAMHGSKIYEQKAYKVKVVDTTGAGDAFTAAFIYSLLRKDSMEFALKFATVCASLNIKSVGAVKNFPTENDILKIIGEKNV
ncbi:MAG: carbohydrate kinase family protein [Candidatus Aenigmarchaeota archaeon]|nr:carbohydrate kinase family protein [Candidatus Aenigmarchaeota archaeon]MCX8179382.1 carbohydrate kinase family protein [Candidatus Aenigmarchaeota archaeon]